MFIPFPTQRLKTSVRYTPFVKVISALLELDADADIDVGEAEDLVRISLQW